MACGHVYDIKRLQLLEGRGRKYGKMSKKKNEKGPYELSLA